ncbi:hypothetical protein BC939DRAFT_444753 [Gamsiella multidivaricata]|uniref:uncharacterized protein n=1 Tax=Gamsiella multidivaricata TaxID=101098 RepID=UPI00221F1F41|nr:uncharacterized protein BC939DRAFT_444753 [Gamsiella multidivaricata]KAG0353760.1 hypothetical protein BGZ54_002060 [Gamsiella multidivaricata]KAI7827608.1 hypothetical protein BC939DRAFT_444753 [Gamsiella multidivaricata]
MELLQRAQALLQECNGIVASLETWKEANPTLEVDGLQKMTSALHSEQKFLEKVASTPVEDIKPVQITSSNVPYLKSLVWALIHSKNPVAVRKTFTYTLDPFTVIEPSEKFKALPEKNNGQSNKNSKGKQGGKIMQLSGSSRPLSTGLSNEQTFQVKIDVVADHGKSWLRINAGSVWSLIHEFAGMEDDSDDDQDEDDEDGEDGDDDDRSNPEQMSRTRARKPVHVSKDTHPDMALLTRSLVLAADQNRLHYYHRPRVTLRFAGVLPGESPALEAMIDKSVHVGRVAQSVSDGTIEIFSVGVVFGPVESSTPAAVSSTPLDPAFSPFAIPESVDDMVLFTKTLHLDITTLMALSSFLCHTIRPDPGLFTSPPLVLQAQQEHEEPLLPLLAKIFEGRERLVMSRTAATRFKSILSVIGGAEEKWRGDVMIHDPLEDQEKDVEDEGERVRIRERWVRASDWAQKYGVFAAGPPRIEVIEDILEPGEAIGQGQEQGQRPDAELSVQEESESMIFSEIPASSFSSSLTSSSSIGSVPTRRELNMTELHMRIFLTGHNARLTTVTANQMGYRTVTRMGQVPSEMSVWYHAPRSLAEAKLPPGTAVAVEQD